MAAVTLAGAVLAAPADAARPPSKGPGGGGGSTTATGNDISYPQCGKPYPKGQAFGIVGVNGGLANNTNKCFADELAWAQQSSGATTQPKASLYVNTGNPSGAGPVWWPTSNTFYDTTDGTDSNDPLTGGSQVTVPTPSYGDCSGTNDAGCAYVYGWAKAYEDFNHRGVPDPSSYTWWLDVETSNSWETPSSTDPGAAYTANIASLRGMIDYFTTQNVEIGIYCTPYQWGQITGITSPDASDPFAGVQTWIAGASSSNTSSFCAEGFTYGRSATLVQYVSGRFDYDVVCG